MTYRTPEELAAQQWPLERFVRGMIRRVAITLTTGVKWQILGSRGQSGGDETYNYEPFTGIGFYSTPPASGKPEAIVAAYGSVKTAAIVATRDEATRQQGAGDLAQGETCVYNDKARIIVKADGTVEIRLHGGVAVSLALKSDVQSIRDYVNNQFCALGGHTHVVSGAATTTIAAVAAAGANPPTTVPANPTGTTQLKAQ